MGKPNSCNNQAQGTWHDPNVCWHAGCKHCYWERKTYYPTVDDIIGQIHGSSIFSTLDLHLGYHQLTMAPESWYITTFAAHTGLFRYKRLSFGINAAVEIFQHAISQLIADISRAINISDDMEVHHFSHATSPALLINRAFSCQSSVIPQAINSLSHLSRQSVNFAPRIGSSLLVLNIVKFPRTIDVAKWVCLAAVLLLIFVIRFLNQFEFCLPILITNVEILSCKLYKLNNLLLRTNKLHNIPTPFCLPFAHVSPIPSCITACDNGTEVKE